MKARLTPRGVGNGVGRLMKQVRSMTPIALRRRYTALPKAVDGQPNNKADEPESLAGDWWKFRPEGTLHQFRLISEAVYYYRTDGFLRVSSILVPDGDWYSGPLMELDKETDDVVRVGIVYAKRDKGRMQIELQRDDGGTFWYIMGEASESDKNYYRDQKFDAIDADLHVQLEMNKEASQSYRASAAASAKASAAASVAAAGARVTRVAAVQDFGAPKPPQGSYVDAKAVASLRNAGSTKLEDAQPPMLMKKKSTFISIKTKTIVAPLPICTVSGCCRESWSGQPEKGCCRTCCTSQGRFHSPECEQRFALTEAERRAYKLWEEINNPPEEKLTCPVCMDTVPKREASMLDCGHGFCTVCLRGYLESKVSDGLVMEKELKCPNPDCGTPMSDIVIQGEIGGTDLWERLLKFRAQMWRPPTLEGLMVVCPTPDCARFEVPLNMKFCKCPLCRKEFCVRCGGDKHDNISCREYQSWKRENDRAENHFQEMMRNEDWKSCPRCGVATDKVSGCYFMTCSSPQCRQLKEPHWCYVCGVALRKDQHFSHYPELGPFAPHCENRPFNRIENI